MAGGPIAVSGVAGDRANLYHNRLTVVAFLYCMLISWAGCLFGLDLGELPTIPLCSHVATLEEFFPSHAHML